MKKGDLDIKKEAEKEVGFEVATEDNKLENKIYNKDEMFSHRWKRKGLLMLGIFAVIFLGF